MLDILNLSFGLGGFFDSLLPMVGTGAWISMAAIGLRWETRA
jgi:hypothetical protein